VFRRLLGRRRKAARIHTLGVAAASVVAVVVAGCSPGPQPFAFGEDQCAHCRMTIMDPAYATQIVTTTGKTYKLDSSECLRAYLASDALEDAEVHSVWVSTVDTRGVVAAEKAWFVRSPDIRSPMGGGLAAFWSRTAAEQAAGSGGMVMDWTSFRSGSVAAATHGHGR